MLLRLAALALAAIVAVVPGAALAAPDEEHEPKLLGIAGSGWSDHVAEIRAAAGKVPAMVQTFWPIADLGSPGYLHAQLDAAESYGMVVYHEIIVGDLDELNEGGLDGQLAAMAGNYASWLLAEPGRHLLVAPLPEANLEEHAWGGDPSGYRAGYRRIRQAFRDAGLGPDQVRFVFSMNGVSTAGSYADYYPGDGVVDLIGFSRINRGDPWREYHVMFTTHIREMQAQISLNKPMLITQTASVGGSERADWLEDMFSGLLTESQVVGAIYFNVSKDHDYRVVVGGSVDPSFAAGYRTWSPPSDVSWIFDGRMDAWEEERASAVFIDVIESAFRSEIEWLAGEGITEGCATRQYCPDDPVTRAQMASFLDRALDLPAASGDQFTDDEGSVHESAINRLATSGITHGCTPTSFCPDDPVTRAQMAAFLNRALET
ncbi:MAG TPA: S-layer homology domain-containing protein [Acidimicrobiia bacterium]|nr:S-layer homology domain-containing protein [Acidimicrobiia bacterium]